MFVLLDVPELLVFALELVLVFCAVLLTVLLVVELVSVDGVVPPFTVVAFPFMVDEVDPVIEPVVAPVCEPVLVFDDVPFEVALDAVDRVDRLVPRLMSFLLGGLRAPLPQFEEASAVADARAA